MPQPTTTPPSQDDKHRMACKHTAAFSLENTATFHISHTLPHAFTHTHITHTSHITHTHTHHTPMQTHTHHTRTHITHTCKHTSKFTHLARASDAVNACAYIIPALFYSISLEKTTTLQQLVDNIFKSGSIVSVSNAKEVANTRILATTTTQQYHKAAGSSTSLLHHMDHDRFDGGRRTALRPFSVDAC